MYLTSRLYRYEYRYLSEDLHRLQIGDKIIIKIIIIIITRDLYCAAKCRSNLRGKGHCTSVKRMTSILWHAAEAFPPARQGTILNSHRVIGIATNTSMVLNCASVTYIMMTADRTAGCSLMSYPGHIPPLGAHPLACVRRVADAPFQ